MDAMNKLRAAVTDILRNSELKQWDVLKLIGPSLPLTRLIEFKVDMAGE